MVFGFDQLWEYFTQFGKVVRVRVARNVKTGNHKGWAYVGFEDKDVAEIAAETMNGYLMFEKRLSCHVMAPEKIPKSMKSGPRYVAPPHMRGRAKRDALKRNKDKTKEQERKSEARRKAAQKRKLDKLKNLGIEYELDSISTSSKADTSEMKKVEKSEDQAQSPKPPLRKAKNSKPHATKVKGTKVKKMKITRK
ncbi:RRM domain-containing protein [Trichostrongylus colubriformis]|uniref:RRM domain-containing protein n=1 Tax=Trichostrongylus colubriformis TaxID=6319 RepID=A0AAN8FPU3_TRICO